MNFKRKTRFLTIKSAQYGIIELDDPLVDEDPFGPIPSFDLNGIICRVDLVDDKAIRRRATAVIEDQVGLLGGGAVEMADNAWIFGRRRGEDGIVEGRIDVIGFEE